MYGILWVTSQTTVLVIASCSRIKRQKAIYSQAICGSNLLPDKRQVSQHP